MAFHHKVKFSTKDQDNEKNKGGCATSLQGAWWFEYCGHSSLNGMYIKGGSAGHNKGINWQKWKGDNYSMKRASMMLRRKWLQPMSWDILMYYLIKGSYYDLCYITMNLLILMHCIWFVCLFVFCLNDYELLGWRH